MQLLLPAEYRPSIHAVDLYSLKDRGIRGMIVDLDNTLVAWDHPDPTPEVRDWLETVQGTGIRPCIVSNNGPNRVRNFSRDLQVPAIASAAKPRRRSFREAMRLLGTEPYETAVVGDQIFTDVLGGNRLGLYTILVVPVTRREFIGTRLVRHVERAVLSYLARKGHLSRP